MLDYETDTDTHFQCPHCGQKGSVPTATLEKALAATPHVHISCSSCAQKFEPFASPVQADEMPTETQRPAQPLDKPMNEPEDGSMDEAVDAPSAAADEDGQTDIETGRDLPPLADHFHAGQEPSADTANEDAGAGSLPSWMMPPQPLPTPDDTPTEAALPADNNSDDTAEDDAALIEDIAAYQADADTPGDEETADDGPAPEEESDKAEATETGAGTLPDDLSDDLPDDMVDEGVDETAEAVSDETHDDIFDTGDELDALDADALLGAVDADDALPVAAPQNDTPATNEALLIDETDGFDTPAAISENEELRPLDTAPPSVSNGPIGVVNGLLLALVLVLATMNIYVLMQENTAPLTPVMQAGQEATFGKVRVENTAFELTGNRVIIAVLFTNETQQDGVIGDFRIHLQDQAGENLASWTQLSTGQSLAPGDKRTVTSILVAPPANIARVKVDYPPQN